MSRIYTTKTPSLKATFADIRRLNGKEISLNGKNILDYITDSEFNSYDSRDPQLKNDELDIWNTAISLSEEGHIEVKSLEHVSRNVDKYGHENLEIGDAYMMNEEQADTLRLAKKVINNEVLGENDEHLMYWQTDGLVHECLSFYTETLEMFDSDLSNLKSSWYTFAHTSINSFNSDLSNLEITDSMFEDCSKLETFSSDLSSLTNGRSMFKYCTNLESFSSDLSSLEDGRYMFYCCNLS